MAPIQCLYAFILCCISVYSYSLMWSNYYHPISISMSKLCHKFAQKFFLKAELSKRSHFIYPVFPSLEHWIRVIIWYIWVYKSINYFHKHLETGALKICNVGYRWVHILQLFSMNQNSLILLKEKECSALVT